MSGVVRTDAAVHKRSAPWTESVDAMLEHLAEHGFGHAPRVMGRDTEGRQLLSWIDGAVPGSSELGSAWTPESLAEPAIIAAAQLLRQMHDAMVGFDPQEPVWMYHGRCRLSVGQIVGHGDVGPWNTVYRDGTPIAFIDFDSAGPTYPIIEAAQAAWAFVPILRAEARQRLGLDHLDPINRLAAFAAAYRISDAPQFLAALSIARAQQAGHAQHWPAGPAAIAEYLGSTVADLHELDRLMPELLRAFQATSESIDKARALLILSGGQGHQQ